MYVHTRGCYRWQIKFLRDNNVWASEWFQSCRSHQSWVLHCITIHFRCELFSLNTTIPRTARGDVFCLHVPHTDILPTFENVLKYPTRWRWSKFCSYVQVSCKYIAIYLKIQKKLVTALWIRFPVEGSLVYKIE